MIFWHFGGKLGDRESTADLRGSLYWLRLEMNWSLERNIIIFSFFYHDVPAKQHYFLSVLHSCPCKTAIYYFSHVLPQFSWFCIFHCKNFYKRRSNPDVQHFKNFSVNWLFICLFVRKTFLCYLSISPVSIWIKESFPH